VTAWLGLVLSILAIVVIPTEAMMIRMAVRWSRVETTLVAIAKDLKELTENKERDHQLIRESATYDRAATDKRLRWLEEHVWNRRKEI
jgi:hypothetical protein